MRVTFLVEGSARCDGRLHFMLPLGRRAIFAPLHLEVIKYPQVITFFFFVFLMFLISFPMLSPPSFFLLLLFSLMFHDDVYGRVVCLLHGLYSFVFLISTLDLPGDTPWLSPRPLHALWGTLLTNSNG